METTYAIHLVILSYIIAVTGSFAALQLAIRIPAATGLPLIGWLLASGVALGGGAIWSMHFIGMNAYHTGMTINYDPKLTVASLVVAILIAAVGLLIVGKSNSKTIYLIIAGIAGGLGVCVMHYLGMAAMIMPATIVYDEKIVGISVAIAITAATAALWLAFNLRGNWQRFGSAFVMGTAVCAMHYTGMHAVHLTHDDSMVAAAAQAGISQNSLGLVIFAGSTVTMILLMVFNLFMDEKNSDAVDFEL